MRLAWLLGLVWGYVGCSSVSCPHYIGKTVPLALVDERGAPVGARGEVLSSAYKTQPFDCTQCVNGVLHLWPVLSPSDTVDIVFMLGDGSWSDPYRVQLTVHEEVVHDLHCEQTVYQGTTVPMVVPAEARLDNG
jgi:hypothetical protein